MPMSGRMSGRYFSVREIERDGPQVEPQRHADLLSHLVSDGLTGLQSSTSESHEWGFIEGIAHYPSAILDLVQVRNEPRLVTRWGSSDAEREVRLAAGAEFVVMVCGDIMTMPGLPKVPSAEHIDLDSEGRVVGLF